MTTITRARSSALDISYEESGDGTAASLRDLGDPAVPEVGHLLNPT